MANRTREEKLLYGKRWAKRNPDKVAAKRRRKSDAIDAFLRLLRGNPCTDCGQTYHHAIMEFDHCRGVKIANVSRFRGTTWAGILNEIEKCDLVCANCHRMRTHVRATTS